MNIAHKTRLQPLGNGTLPRVLSSIYGSVVSLRNFLYDNISALSQEAGRPVISVGGVHAGGTGKTPMSLLVARQLVERGYSIAFLSRGYGRAHKEMVICKPGEPVSWNQVGDEPALLHEALPQSWLGICPNRRKSARDLRNLVPGNTVFVLDDGFQHRQVKRTADIVCIPPDPFADSLIPAGRLREPLVNLKRANFICIIGSMKEKDACIRTREKLLLQFPGKGIYVLFQVPGEWRKLGTGETSKILPFRSPLLLSGIARPDRFSMLIADMGIRPCASHFFDDHHVFTINEIEGLYGGQCDGIVTTEKDAFRLSTIKLVNGPDIWYLKIDVSFADGPSRESFFEHLNDSIQSYIPKRRYCT